MMLSKKGIKYPIGLWETQDENEYSNWKEFKTKWKRWSRERQRKI
jgi:hypothetical protein